ncbi:carboxymuconolactone decarboxylase family protein [Kitasatospora sp. NPDC006697]|uniref:carboxymuconolactone decarboxylase family protein n=1 Tax=Kitasatospora sp. NPDC006697 TaxID=3364020 RepID=UPI00369A930A
MQARMQNPAVVIPEAVPAVLDLLKAVRSGGVPERTLELVNLRAAQLNGCSACADAGVRSARRAGEADERLFAVAAWRDTRCFTAAERAALALTEAATRLADLPSGARVPEEVWQEAAAHYDERQLAALVLAIGTANLLNRLNVTTRQVAGMPW